MAQVVVTTAAWTDLGAGPLRVQALNSEVFIATGATAPGTLGGGVVLRPSDGAVDFDTTTLHVFAMSAAVSGSAVVATVAVTA